MVEEPPVGLVEVRVCANMRGVRYGDVVLVDPDDPDIATLIEGNLLVPLEGET